AIGLRCHTGIAFISSRSSRASFSLIHGAQSSISRRIRSVGPHISTRALLTASFGPSDIGSNNSTRYLRPGSSSGRTDPRQRSRKSLRRSPNRRRRILSSLESLTRGRRPGNPVIAYSYFPGPIGRGFFCLLQILVGNWFASFPRKPSVSVADL